MLKKTLTSLHRSYNEGSRSTGCATVYTILAQIPSCKKLIFNYFLLTHVYEDNVFLVTQYKDYSMYLSYCNFYWNILLKLWLSAHDVRDVFIFNILYKFEYWTRLACQARQVVSSLWNVPLFVCWSVYWVVPKIRKIYGINIAIENILTIVQLEISTGEGQNSLKNYWPVFESILW